MWLHDIKIAFFLDTSFNKRVGIWGYGLVKKIFSTQWETEEETVYLISKKIF